MSDINTNNFNNPNGNFDWELGFTPANFATLITASGLSKKEFYERFNISKVMCYNYLRGDNTPSYEKWRDLCNQVSEFIKNKAKNN